MHQGHADYRPLRIALFLHDLRGGGVERVSIHLANGMVEKGHDVDLVLIRRDGPSSYFEMLAPKINVIDLCQRRTLTSPIAFRRYMRRHAPDAVVSALTHVNVSALIASRLTRSRPPIIVVEHNQQIYRRAMGQMADMPAALKAAFAAVPLLYPDADAIGVVSEGIRERLAATIAVPKERFKILHNPVVTAELIAKSEVPLDHPWFCASAPPVVLGVGSLFKEKNFELLIKAFALVRKDRDLRLVILGSGPMRPRLQQVAKDTGYGEDILLLGFVANPYQFMRTAAVVALSSDWEGLPTVIIEAMACGTAVAATDCQSGPAEILMQGELGPLSPCGDVEGFAGALKTVLDHPVDPARLIERASSFKVEAATERYLNAIRNAMQARAVLRALH